MIKIIVSSHNLWNGNARILVSDKIDVRCWQIFANKHSAVITSFIIPLVLPVFEQKCGAGLVAETIGFNCTIWLSRSPIIEHIIRSEVSRRHHSQSTGPKPSVDIQRLEPCSITAFNFGITQATGSVNSINIAGLHEAFDEVLFPQCF